MRMTLLLTPCAALVLLAGCSAEPDFDQRFEARSRELADKARTIEAESRAQIAAAREAEQAASEVAAPAAAGEAVRR